MQSKMIRTAILVLALGLLQQSLFAQENGQRFNLEQAVEYALKNSVAVKNAVLDQQSAAARVGEVRATGLPQIDGQVQITHSDPLQRMFFTLDEDNPLLGNDPGLSQLPLEDGSVIALPNFFQLPSTGDASISASQLIFNSSYFVGLKAAKTYKELAYKGVQQSEIETTAQVTKAFYSILINRERLGLFDKNIARVDSLLRDTKAMYKNGFAENIDVSRVQVTLNNLQIEKAKFENLLALSQDLLKFQMNYPMDQPIEIDGDLKTVDAAMADALTTAGPTDYSQRIEYSLLETQRDLRELDVRNNNLAYLPTISAFGKYGYLTQSPDLKGVFQTNTHGIPDEAPLGPDKWYPYGMFGVTLNLPIFDGLAKSYKIQQAKIEMKKLENNFDQLESSIDLQINQARTTLKNNLSTLKSQQENVELAEEVARVTRIKYLNGVGSNFEFTQAETALKEAQTNYYNALYDVIVARIDLKLALGTPLTTDN